MAKFIPAGLAALCVLTPLIPSESDGYQGNSIVLAVAWLLWLVTWGAGTVLKSGVTSRVRRADVVWPILLLLLGLSTWLAVRTGNPRLAWNDCARWILIFTMPFLCRQVFVHPVQQRSIVLVLIALAVVCSAHGYHQVFYSMPRMRLAYEQNPEQTLQDLGIAAPPGSALRYQFENRLRSPEPLSTFALTNSLAGFLLPWLAIAARLATRVTRERGAQQFTVTLLIIVLLISGCFAWTGSRSAHVAFVLGVSWALFRECPPRQQKWLLVFLITATAMLIGLAWLGRMPEGLWRSAWQSLQYRFEYWQATWPLIQDRPWLGCGPGQFQDTYMAYKLPQASETIADPHNLLLEIAAVLGIPALIAFLFGGEVIWRSYASELTSTESAQEEIKPIVVTGDRSMAAWMIAGGGVGLLIAFPLGAIVGFPPDGVLLWLGLPLAIGCVAQGWDWVIQGNLPSAWLRLALLMLILHLMGAGGISFAGVAVSLAVLWGILAARQLPSHAPTFPRWGLAICIGLFVLVVRLAYLPLVHARGTMMDAELYLQRAGQGGRGGVNAFKDAAATYALAATQDPWSPEPPTRLASLCHVAWLANLQQPAQAEIWRKEFLTSCSRMLQLQPRSYSAHHQAGVWMLAAYRSTNEPELLANAVQYFTQAIQCYPHHAAAHAELAWTAHIAHNEATAQSAALRALELDQLNPHHEHDLTRYSLPDPGPTPQFASQQVAGPGADFAATLLERMTTSRSDP